MLPKLNSGKLFVAPTENIFELVSAENHNFQLLTEKGNSESAQTKTCLNTAVSFFSCSLVL